MKKRYWAVFGLIVVFAVFAYYISYKTTSDMLGNTKNDTELTKEEDYVLPVDTNKEKNITNKTKYTLETYNSKDYTLDEQLIPMPVEFIGLTREEIIEYLKEYENAPSLEDREKGFKSFELISFSEDNIVLRKTYYPYDIYKYYLTDEDGFVTVYYSDHSTVYEYTSISTNNLPDALREEIKNGKYISDLSELYNFLENYSS